MKAIEEVFVPVVVFNNQPGKDAAILKRYKEPSWNFQVVRYLDGEGKDIVPRKDRVWTTAATAARMVDVLEKLGKAVPEDLKALAAGAKGAVVKDEREAVFAMHFETASRTWPPNWEDLGFEVSAFADSRRVPAQTPPLQRSRSLEGCYWEGEARLGAIDGVLSTEAGWLEGREVVKVRYDAKRAWVRRLVRAASDAGCAGKVWVGDEKEAGQAREIVEAPVAVGFDGYRTAADREQKYYLARSAYAGLELTEEQRTKVNAALRLGGDPGVFLKREQLAQPARSGRR